MGADVVSTMFNLQQALELTSCLKRALQTFSIAERDVFEGLLETEN